MLVLRQTLLTLEDVVSHTMRLMMGISHGEKGLRTVGQGLIAKDAPFTKGVPGQKISIAGHDRYQPVWDDVDQ